MSQQLAPAPIGIDIGTYKSKIAVAKRGGVQVITNQANFRQTPCIVGYGKQQRQIGQSGNIKMKSNFKDTVVSPMRFLGLDSNYPLLRAQTKFSPARTQHKDGRIHFQVNYQGTPQSLLAQQVMAAYFNKLKIIIAKNGFQNKQVVISVPTYLTQAERKAYFDAAKIAQLNIKLINDSTAVALDYGLFRKGDLDAEKPRNVLFIDYGHSKLGVFVCSFTKTQMNVLEQQYCRNVGCRDIDYHLYQFYRGVFQKTSGGLDLSQSKKAYVKLMQNIQRQRKILSGNLQHDLNIEYLMQQNDLNYTMKRQQFQKISEPIFNEIKRVLTKIRQQLKAKNIPINSIQLIGGGTRIPIFITSVKQVFNVQPSRTLNSSQSVARGCALLAAIKSPLFKVQQYTLNQRVYNGVKFYWNFVQGNNYLGLDSTKYPQTQAKMIHDFGAKIPSSKTIKFKRRQPIEILIEYQPAVNGFNKHIGYYRTPAQNPQHQTFGVSFKIKHNQDGLITFEQCLLVQQWTEQTKVPKKKQTKKQQKKDQKKQGDQPAPQGQVKPQPIQQQQFEVKKTKKQTQRQIKFQVQQFRPISEQDIQKFFTLESEMLNNDKLILQTYEKKNQLQSISYKWKQYLTSTHKQYVKQQDIPAILKLLQENSEWLYNDGQHATRGAYSQRIEKINSKILPIKNRFDTLHQISQQIINFHACLDSNFQLLNSLDKKYQHISVEQRQESYNFIERCRSWVQNVQEKQTAKNKWQQAVTSVNQLKNKMKQVNDNVKKTMSKPVPKPAQPKKQQPKNQKMDVQTESKPAEPSDNAGQTKPQKMQTQ